MRRAPLVSPALALGIAAIVLTALLFWPKRGLYRRWKRRFSADSQVPPLRDTKPVAQAQVIRETV